MHTNDPVIPSWRRNQWIRWVSLLFLAQLLLVFLLAERRPESARKAPVATQLRMITQADENRSLAASLRVFDPMLMAGVSPNNYSGSAWLRARENNWKQKDWTDSSTWYPRVEPTLPHPSGASGRPAERALLSREEKPTPHLAAVEGKSKPLPYQTTVHLEGSLAKRKLLSVPNLPAQSRGSVTSPTWVEIKVDGDGTVFSFRRLRSCGVAAADQSVLEFLKTARFEGVKTSPATASGHPGLETGLLIVDWATRD